MASPSLISDLHRNATLGSGKANDQTELEALAAMQLAKWEKHVVDGHPIPPVRRQIAAPRHAPGPTPAQLLKAQAEAAKLKRI